MSYFGDEPIYDLWDPGTRPKLCGVDGRGAQDASPMSCSNMDGARDVYASFEIDRIGNCFKF